MHTSASCPEALHPSLDKVVAKGKDAFGPVKGVSQLVLDCWGVSVRTEDALARGALQVDALEFFLKLMARFSVRFEWPLVVGSFTVGRNTDFLDPIRVMFDKLYLFCHC